MSTPESDRADAAEREAEATRRRDASKAELARLKIDLNKFKVEEHTRTVVFCHGAWSGPSVYSLRLLKKVLERANQPVELLIVECEDVASTTEKHMKKLGELFGEIGGWGECCWISNRKIVARDILGKNTGTDASVEALIEQRIRQLDAPDN